jgi:hypothetical protein
VRGTWRSGNRAIRVAQFNKLRQGGHRDAGLIPRHIDSKDALTTVSLETPSGPFMPLGLAHSIPASAGIIYKTSQKNG